MPPREPDFIEPPLPPLAWDALPGLFPGFADPGRWLPLLRRHLALVEAGGVYSRLYDAWVAATSSS